MDLNEIKYKLTTPEYNFLKDNPHLGDHIILLGLGGSYSYGTNIETSDLDVRGVATNSKMEILTNRDFEQVTNEVTDTVIYSFDKIVSLLTKCNPNTIEMLGLHPDHYLYVSPLGQELIDHQKLFLSKKAINSFAFVDCISLTSITIPDSVTSIGNGAFAYCSSLTSITIPSIIVFMLPIMLGIFNAFGRGDISMCMVIGGVSYLLTFHVAESLFIECFMILLAEVFFIIKAIIEKNLKNPFCLKEKKPLGPSILISTFIILIGSVL